MDTIKRRYVNFSASHLNRKDFVFLEALTLGLFSFVWWHYNWHSCQHWTKTPDIYRKIPTFLLTLVSPFISYQFTQAVVSKAEQQKIPCNWDPFVISCSYFIMRSALYLQLFGVINHPVYIVLGILSFVPLIPVHHTLSKLAAIDDDIEIMHYEPYHLGATYLLSLIGWGGLISYLLVNLLPNSYIAEACIHKNAHQTAHTILQIAADSGNPRAQAALGKFYAKPEHRLHNPELALHWFKKAANQGHCTANLKLAQHYYLHNGHDVELAVAHYQHAAKRLPIAKTQLAYLHEQNTQSVNNTQKALQLYHEAAHQGEKHAQYRLATHYAHGHKMHRNLANAHYWYLNSAQKGMPCAQKAMGDLYAEGTYLRQDLRKARYWYRKAAKHFASHQQVNTKYSAKQNKAIINQLVLTGVNHASVNTFCNTAHLFVS